MLDDIDSENQSGSTFFEENKIDHKKQSLLNCPTLFKIQYIDNQLIFEWDCQKTQCEQGIFFRQILIIDASFAKDDKKLIQTIENFYKRMRLGDFLKIYLVGTNFKKDWIQKTSQKLDEETVRKKNNAKFSLLDACNQAFALTEKYSQLISINIFVNSLYSMQNQLQLKIKQITNQKKCLTNLFFYQSATASIISKFGECINYQIQSDNQLDEKLKISFHSRNKIRAKTAQLFLTCLNGDIYLNHEQKDKWNLTAQGLSIKFFAIHTYTRYICKLSINTFKIDKAQFEVKFILNLLGDNKYQFDRKFSLEVDNKAATIQEAEKKMKFNSPNNYYTSLIENGLEEFIETKKILIRNRINQHQYFTYQKQSFE